MRWLAAGVALAALDAIAVASARADEPWLLELEASGGAPVSLPQRDWFGAGGSLALGVARPLSPWLLVEGRLRTALFLDGEPPETPGTRDPDLGTLNSATIGLVLRLADGSERRATGPWLGAGIGGALTGKEVRATWEAGLGYGFGISETLALGPLVRFVQVVQPNDDLAPRDARILLAGARLSLRDARPRQETKPTADDRDGDGSPDARDRCIDVAEDKDGFDDHDGCPEPDNDGDGVADAADGCPNIPEDKDGFDDEDGCPDEDNDHDGVLDAADQCPLEPETINGERDDDGCPDQGLIEMRDDRVVLEERVLFDTNSPRIKKSAEPVLRAIIKLQSQHPEWEKMRVEGHADARGEVDFNQQLSERRATHVREALIGMGMPPSRIVAEGFGATRLLTTEISDEAHQRNRRVEFVVIGRSKGVSAPLLVPRAPSTESRVTPSPAASPAQSKEHAP